MVVTRTTRNRFVCDEQARGFESHHLRHRRHKLCIACDDFLCKNHPALTPLFLLFPKSLPTFWGEHYLQQAGCRLFLCFFSKISGRSALLSLLSEFRLSHPPDGFRSRSFGLYSPITKLFYRRNLAYLCNIFCSAFCNMFLITRFVPAASAPQTVCPRASSSQAMYRL